MNLENKVPFGDVGFSYWEKTSFFEHQDIIIIGSGFVGLWTAIELQQKHPHYNITILERGLLPVGASTKNAGFSCFGSPTELIHDATIYGEAAMWNLVDKRYNGLRKIHNTFSYTSIDYENCGGYECLLEKDYEPVAAKLDWLNKGLKQITGIENVFAFCNEKMKHFGLTHFDHLVENKLEGYLQPAKLVQQLQQKAMGLGVQILTGIDVTSYENGKTVTLRTNIDTHFSCDQLIVCNNAFAQKLLQGIDVEPKRGQVFITGEIEGLSLKGCFHFDEGFYYFRNVGKRLLIGGARNKDFENENTDSFGITENIQKQLQQFTQKHILQNKSFEITHQWSGIMGFGKEKKPIIQKLEENIYCAIRMSGMGVALAPMVAEDVAEMLTVA
jgi:gamma-glutamylputrescine oxidase